MTLLALLSTALLFGGMVFYSFGLAAFLFSNLPPEQAGRLLRRAFPKFYLLVLIVSGVSALLMLSSDAIGGLLLACIAATVVPTWRVLMPAINNATDHYQKSRFKLLHAMSVAITLGHIVIAAAVLSSFV